VNHLSTTLLCILLLPKLKAAATNGNPHPRLVVVSSEVHYFAQIPAQAVSTPNILETLNRKDYSVSWCVYRSTKVFR
jgi:retinol dehydrogenase 12